MKNPIESIKRLIRKTWSEAPSLASSELLKLYHTNPRLDGVRMIASKCASTELYLYDKADLRKNKNNAEIIEEHEIYELLENPCPNFRDLTGWHIRYFVFACYTLVGEGYLLKIRDKNGKVISLSPMSPSWIVKTPTDYSDYWEIYPYGVLGGNSIIVPNQDVICFKDINLNDPFGRGKGTAESIGDIESALFSYRHTHGVLNEKPYRSRFRKALFVAWGLLVMGIGTLFLLNWESLGAHLLALVAIATGGILLICGTTNLYVTRVYITASGKRRNIIITVIDLFFILAISVFYIIAV